MTNNILEEVTFDEIPSEILDKVFETLTEDILTRYDNPEYHDPEIMPMVLANYGYKLKNQDNEDDEDLSDF